MGRNASTATNSRETTREKATIATVLCALLLLWCLVWFQMPVNSVMFRSTKKKNSDGCQLVYLCGVFMPWPCSRRTIKRRLISQKHGKRDDIGRFMVSNHGSQAFHGSEVMIVVLLLVITWLHEPVHSAAPASLVFRDLDSKELNARINLLDSPFALVSTSKEAYGLDETSDIDLKCSPLLVRITDRASLLNDVERPQVIISGEIHGDERVVRCM